MGVPTTTPVVATALRAATTTVPTVPIAAVTATVPAAADDDAAADAAVTAVVPERPPRLGELQPHLRAEELAASEGADGGGGALHFAEINEGEAHAAGRMLQIDVDHLAERLECPRHVAARHLRVRHVAHENLGGGLRCHLRCLLMLMLLQPVL
jgi:hypothetical protein